MTNFELALPLVVGVSLVSYAFALRSKANWFKRLTLLIPALPVVLYTMQMAYRHGTRDILDLAFAIAMAGVFSIGFWPLTLVAISNAIHLVTRRPISNASFAVQGAIVIVSNLIVWIIVMAAGDSIGR